MRTDPMFEIEAKSHAEVLRELDTYTVCASDPPWSGLAGRVPPPLRLVTAGNMDIDHLEALLATEPDSLVVVGLGGGSALDTAKFIAWRTGKDLVQIPSIASVDAAFTDAVGVRVGGNVKYVGEVVPKRVIVDLDLITAAPARLNRAGIGDILSCVTALEDWRLSAERGEGVEWDRGLADLGAQLVDELVEHAGEVGAASPAAILWMISAYQRIGAACRAAGHSRFEEGSEHFLAYCFEARTGARLAHGELVALSVVAMARLQNRNQDLVSGVIERSGITANPLDLGIDREQFVASLLDLAGYVRQQHLDFSVIDLVEIGDSDATSMWDAVTRLPRRAS